MKLYLSSYKIPNVDKFVRFIGLPKKEINLAVVYNAKDHLPAELRKQKFGEFSAVMNKDGLAFFEVDLRNYRNEPDRLKKELQKANVIWVNGGNTFQLRYAMAESGFDTMIRELLSSGIIYAGDSAGAIVAGPTLEGFGSIDDQNAAPKVTIEGLGLTELIVLPHWGDPEYDSGLRGIEKQYKESPYTTVRLENHQAVFITEAGYNIK